MVKSSNFISKLWRKIIPDKNAKFTFSSPRPQSFSLPYNFIEYVRKNPLSPNGLQKLQQTCKYFFAKQKILIIRGSYGYAASRIIIHKQITAAGIQYLKKRVKTKALKKNKDYNFENVFLWFTDSVDLNDEIPKDVHCIYRCNAKRVTLNSAIVPLNFFNMLICNNIINLSISKSQIVYDDGSNVPVHIILEKLPNITHLHYANQKDTNDVLQKLNSLSFKNMLKSFSISLYHSPTSFGYQQFTKFIQRCCDSSCAISINISSLPSDEGEYVKIWLESVKQELKTVNFDISEIRYH